MILIYRDYLKVKRKYLRSVFIICVGVFSLLMTLFAYETAAQAQEVGGGESRWQITPSLSFYEQYTDNVDLTAEDQVSAFITEFSPGLLFELPASRRQIRINTNLKLDYRQRSDDNTETLYWYNLWGYWGRQHSPRTSYEVSMGYDIYYTEKDISAPFVDVFGALTRSDVFYIQPGLSYDITKNTNAKVGLRYGFSTYEDPSGVDGEDLEGSLFMTQRIGSRIKLGLGYSYRDISYENETGYTDSEVPFEIRLDLTYLQLNLSGAYVMRDYQEMAGPEDEPFGSDTFFTYGIGFELGGQVLKLRSTIVELNYETRVYDDMQGVPYQIVSLDYLFITPLRSLISMQM